MDSNEKNKPEMTVRYFVENFMYVHNISFVSCYRTATDEERETEGFKWEDSGPVFLNTMDYKDKNFRRIEDESFLEYWGDKTVRKFAVLTPGEYITPDGEVISVDKGMSIRLYTI